MADQDENATHSRVDDDIDRPKPGRAPSLAEDASDDLPAFMAFAVGIAIIVVLFWQAGLNDSSTTATVDHGADETGEAAADDAHEDDAAHDDEGADDGAADDGGEDEVVGAEIDVAAATAALDAAGIAGLTLSADGGVLTATGEIADEAQRAQVLDTLGALPGVETVIDELTVAAPTSSESTITATQASILLSGTVPSQAMADEILARAQSIYGDDQIDNELVVDESVATPVSVTITGAMSDPVLHQRVLTGFDGIEGLEVTATDALVLEESSAVETSLNELEGVQFGSGSAVILPESAPILDEAAAVLTANPDLVVEIGGHTDSLGSDESNQRLSQARADSVVAELVARGVTNELQPRGFGESRLKVDPDDTAEAQQENRRIEFRLLG